MLEIALKYQGMSRKQWEHPFALEASFSGSTHPPNAYSLDDLPKTVVRLLNQGSNVMSMDFHPQQQTILLVGTNVGEISIWEVGSRERMIHKPFKVWDLSACSMPFQTTLVKDAAVSVNCCIWGPDGSILGVAFSKHIVQIYTYNQSRELRQHLEIDAHVGGVNDIAFAEPNKQLCIVTCGDDKTIRVWDAVVGLRLYMLEGHEAPVYSVCPHSKEQIQFIFSTAIDGKIKAWLYDSMGSRAEYDAPGLWCTMAYSTDGKRLFSCGTSKEGEAHLVEWNESEGAIKREYSGFKKRSMGVVQFDTTKNRFLAAGDEFQIKFWDMDNKNLLTTTAPNNGLPERPRLRFNKEGSLLAVSTSDNGFIILANGDGQRMSQMLESQAYERSQALSDMVKLPMQHSITGPLSPIPDIVDSSHFKALRLPDPIAARKVVRLMYTHSGSSLLALDSSGIHKLWKWQRSERNPSGKSTASIVPELWQPANGALMSNDVNESKPAEQSAACIALTKNDSYLISASGGKVSLFNMMTFKVMTTFMPPPPAATYLAFHPQDNNIIAIGMEDSTIQIYNVRVDEVKITLRGHQKHITGLAFSETSLISSGADAQLCIWDNKSWEKTKSRSIQSPPGHPSSLVGETEVQFHNDQRHLLVVHESQIAIFDYQLECLRLWSPRESLVGRITSARYSCNGLFVITGFLDGAVGVFDADTLSLRCQIAPSDYLSATISSNHSTVYPVVIAAHPSHYNQFALGMNDGYVHVIEVPNDLKLDSSAPLGKDTLASVLKDDFESMSI
ncbi:hypothetical protein L2E82_48182 [Cichorium intybus]|uniref:Uncharacterized protein n=1 Tax=Cichorium intybus TaxID=13427 RepID=A0ACB8YYM7_CICIN|nr:hypothetical protein L2E82_48182 [Cichorium intybus]